MLKHIVKSTMMIFAVVLLTIGLHFNLWAINNANQEADSKNLIHTVQNINELKQLLDSSGDHLLMLDLYADWCMPCRILSPVLEEIAQEYRDIVKIYKINIDKNPDIARAFNVSGIPFVVLIKNKTVVYGLTGVQPKENYVRALNLFSDKKSEIIKTNLF
jgi:thioredoxin 1